MKLITARFMVVVLRFIWLSLKRETNTRANAYQLANEIEGYIKNGDYNL